MTSRSRLLIVAAAAVAALSLAARVGIDAGGDRSIVAVAERDEHGVAVRAVAPLRAEPAGRAAAWVPAGTLLEVHDQRPPWLRVTTLQGATATGWIDEFLVRGAFHVVDPAAPACATATPAGVLEPSARVRIVDVHRDVDGIDVGVVPMATAVEHHVPRESLREVPGPPPVPGRPCTSVVGRPATAHDH